MVSFLLILSPMQQQLLGFNNAKTVKGESLGYRTAILYLAPADSSGVANLCPHASAGCKAACLFTSGRAQYLPKINEARIRKTLMLKNNVGAFTAKIRAELKGHVTYCKKNGLIPCVRLIGTSDSPWESESFGFMQDFPDLQFYDYTKNVKRAIAWAEGKMPKNYHITFSRSETNQEDCAKVLAAGGNVAVVFSGKMPDTYMGYPVFSGDETDLRFLDPKGAVIGLISKGRARYDTTGFVVHTPLTY